MVAIVSFGLGQSDVDPRRTMTYRCAHSASLLRYVLDRVWGALVWCVYVCLLDDAFRGRVGWVCEVCLPPGARHVKNYG